MVVFTTICFNTMYLYQGVHSQVCHLNEHVHRQRDVQGRFAWLHLQTVQAPLQVHFTNSLQALDAIMN